jgi:hypothetical protein
MKKLFFINPCNFCFNIFLKFTQKYKFFFDKKLSNSTLTVAFVCIILFWVVFTINNLDKINISSLQANIIESKKVEKFYLKEKDNFIKIDGKVYKLILIENYKSSY